MFDRRSQIFTLAARYSVPAIYFSRDWAAAGGLMSCGPPTTDQGRQADIYTGRILKGEKPADLPVGQATRFEFIINLAKARVIGVEVLPALFSIADEVIEQEFCCGALCRLLADTVAKVVLHWWSEILRAADAIFV